MARKILLVLMQSFLTLAGTFLLTVSSGWVIADPPKAPLLGCWQSDDGTLLHFESKRISIFQPKKGLRFFFAEYKEHGPAGSGISVHLKPPFDDKYKKDAIKIQIRGDALNVDEAGILPKASKFRKLNQAPAELEIQLIKLGKAQPLPEKETQEIQKELARRFGADQNARRQPSKEDKQLDADNPTYLTRLIQKVGWIDVKRFGVEAASAAMMIAHHSGNVSLMATAMPEIKKDFQAGKFAGNPAMMLYPLMYLRFQELQAKACSDEELYKATGAKMGSANADGSRQIEIPIGGEEPPANDNR